jgi:hypothetical protein
VNVGLSYRFWSSVDVGVAWMGGRELAINLSVALDPTKPNFLAHIDEPPPFTARTEAEAIAAQTQIEIAAGGSNSGGLTNPGGSGTAGPITKPIVASAGDSGVNSASPTEPWRVHFVDLTVPDAAPDGRPADPAMSSAATERSIGSALSDAGLHVTDNWVDGHTLVVQIDNTPKHEPNSICEALSRQGRSIVRRAGNRLCRIRLESDQVLRQHPTAGSGTVCCCASRIFHDAFAARLDPETAQRDHGSTHRRGGHRHQWDDA